MVRSTEIPAGSLLADYQDRHPAYADCFTVTTPVSADLPAFMRAFFDSPVFRLERRVLAVIGFGPSTAEEVAALAEGRSAAFTAWRVVERRENAGERDGEILLEFGPKDGPPRGCTWLQAACDAADGATALRFGSGVRSGKGARLSPLISATIPLHRFYSRQLLGSAERELRRRLSA